MHDRLTPHWSAWYPLWGAGANRAIPTQPGLYRVRRVGLEVVDYIGQTGIAGRGLRERLGMLRGVYGAEMPYADPHTAAPALWALRHGTGCEFEASIAVVDGDAQWRKGLEALAIAHYRQERDESPIVEFGRMPSGYRGSSGNNERIVAAGNLRRGGPTDVATARNVGGVPPAGPLGGDPVGPTWCGHRWSAWQPALVVARGLYRIRSAAAPRLLYVGQGTVAGRVAAHLAKRRATERPQGAVFAAGAPLEASWVDADPCAAHQLLELENDLIAAHLQVTGEVPAAQFLG